MKINIKGMEETIAAIDKLALEVEEEHAIVAPAAEIVKQAVFEEAPKRKGKMRGHIAIKKGRGGEGETLVHSGRGHQAHILEFGRSAGRKQVGRRTVTWGAIRPNPFFARGFSRSQRDAQNAITKEVKKRLEV